MARPAELSGNSLVADRAPLLLHRAGHQPLSLRFSLGGRGEGVDLAWPLPPAAGDFDSLPCNACLLVLISEEYMCTLKMHVVLCKLVRSFPAAR